MLRGGTYTISPITSFSWQNLVAVTPVICQAVGMREFISSQFTFDSPDLGHQGADIPDWQPVAKPLAPDQSIFIHNSMHPAVSQHMKRARPTGNHESILVIPKQQEELRCNISLKSCDQLIILYPGFSAAIHSQSPMLQDAKKVEGRQSWMFDEFIRCNTSWPLTE